MEDYINIYGLLFAKTADGKLAFTGQIYDKQLQKFQSDINKATPQLNEEGKLPIDLLPEPLQNATSVEIVAVLPETGEANKIYLVKNEGSNPVAYDASMWIDNSWASFGGSGSGLVAWDNVTDKPQILDTYQLPSNFKFNTPVSDDAHTAIMAANVIILPDTHVWPNMVFTKTFTDNSTISFASGNSVNAWTLLIYNISDRILQAPRVIYLPGNDCVKYVRQNLSTEQKTLARGNIQALNSLEFYDFLAGVIAPMYIGEGDEDFTQYDMSISTSPMCVFLQRLMAFMDTIDESYPVFWVYSDSIAEPGVMKWFQIVAWKNNNVFSVVSITGDLSEYEIIVNNDFLPVGLKLRRTINMFKSTTSNTVKGIEVVQGTAPMQQDNILYIELEETT